MQVLIDAKAQQIADYGGLPKAMSIRLESQIE